MNPDPRDAIERNEPTASRGGGSPRQTGYGQGGLGADPGEKGDSWDAPGVSPDGHRTGSSTDGPRTAMDGEAEPDPDQIEER